MTVQTLERRIDAEGLVWHLIVTMDDDGKVVGSATVSRFNRDVPVLENFVVSDTHRRQGHGTAIVTEALRVCRDLGKADLGLTVAKVNTDAIQFYRRLGFASAFADETHLWMGRPTAA